MRRAGSSGTPNLMKLAWWPRLRFGKKVISTARKQKAVGLKRAKLRGEEDQIRRVRHIGDGVPVLACVFTFNHVTRVAQAFEKSVDGERNQRKGKLKPGMTLAEQNGCIALAVELILGLGKLAGLHELAAIERVQNAFGVGFSRHVINGQDFTLWWAHSNPCNWLDWFRKTYTTLSGYMGT